MLLVIATFGLYGLYWFYRNWRDLKEEEELDISPGWRTAGLFVPFLNIYLIYKQFQRIRRVARDVNVNKDDTYSPGWMTVLYVLIAVVAMALEQQTLNAYWRALYPQRRVRPVAVWEIVVIVGGVLLWVASFF